MNQHRFGVNAVYLGAKAARTPDERPGPAGWSGALLFDEFYRANGNPGLVTPTKAQAAWDDTFLYVLFLNWESAENADQVRRDIDELVVSSGTLGHRDFAVFSVGRNGEAHGILESGMTYIGGDEAFGGSQPNLPFRHVGNQADIRTIDPQSYTVVVDHQTGFWSAAYKIPWTLVGGFPKGDCFAFQVYRKKQATGEILCPTPLDLYINLPYWFEYDPSTFMEAYLGGDAGPVYGTELYAVLPSARRRWTRYTEISGVQPGELKQLWTELTALPETTEENVAAHVALAQRLQDVLYQEAVDFFWDEAGSRPVGHMEPWNERHVFNELLAAGEAGKAYARLNRFLRWLARYIQWYYTDGTLGDQSADWTPYEQLRQVTTENSKIVLDFGNAVPTLELIFAEAGFRLKSKPDGGLFSAVPDTFTVSEDGAVLRAAAGNRNVVITRGANWSVVLSVGDRQVFFMDKETLSCVHVCGKDGFRLQMPLLQEESVIGFGERFNGVDQRGHIVAMYQRDAYLSVIAGLANESYKNIPLVHFSSGYTLYINSTYRMRADVGVQVQDRFSITVQDPHVDLYFWGDTPVENMASYARLTGLPILPPRWAFEPWSGAGGGRWMNGPLHNVMEEQIGVLQKFKELDIPHGGFYAEGAGAGGKHLAELHRVSNFAAQNGIHTFSWEYSVMSAERAKAFLQNSGDTEDLPISKTPQYTGNMQYISYIDFTHPRAMELLQAQWKDRFDAGICGTMVDFGDKIPDEAVFSDGRNGKEMHNGYALDYARGYRKLFESAYGDDHVLFQRAGTPGCQAYACQFGGDQPTTFPGMQQSLSGMISVSASGLPFWGVDACGYDGFSGGDAETYIRWTQWAAFCPLMRYHGTFPKEPWEYSEQVTELYKFYTWLRENLLPYAYSTAVQAHHRGIPMVRPLPMMFPEDAFVAQVTDAYMYGDHLLVAPICTDSNRKQVIFPAGRYVNFFDNTEVVNGDTAQTRTYPITEIPVYVAAGALFPVELNESLEFGRSMTTSRIRALVLTQPVCETAGSWNGSDTEENDYAFTVGSNGFSVQAKGCAGVRYLLVKGVSNVQDVILNGVRLRRMPAKQGLNLHEAYFVAQDGTIYIRIFAHSDLQMDVVTR